jgi:kumamolisin
VRADDPPTLQSNVTHAGTLVGRTNAQQQVTLAVPLKIAKQSDLDAFLRDLYDPKSPSFHHYLTPAEFTKRYVDAKARQQVVNFLRGKNLTVTDSGLGTVINATGTVAQVESAFSVTLSDYRDSAGKVYYGNDRTAALPASIAALTHGVLGLDNAPSDQPHFMEAPSQPQPRSQSDNPQTPSGCAAAVNIANRFGSFTPNQLSTAYNFDFFATNGLHGEAQTVALYEADNYVDSNVAAYQSCFGTTVPVTRIPVDGGASLGSGEIEVELDIDVIVGMAPRLAQLLVYNGPNTTASAINQYQQIATDNFAQVVSTSWGNCEPNRSSATLNARYAIFQQMAAQGQSMFAASGDDGSEDCQSGPINAIAVDDPSSQPFVTGVGGTRLTINGSTNQYNTETVWNRFPSGGAGGGGISTFWAKPSYQVGPGTVNARTTGMRQVPDITANADPFTGYTVYVHSPTNCPSLNGTNDCFEPVGGTSASAPFWAAATALVNQVAIVNGGTRVGFVNPQLYLYLANISNPNATHPFPFHDVTVGDNCYKTASGCGSPNSGSGIYPATVAYDQASGIGSMNAGALALASASPIVSNLSRSVGQAAGGMTLTITGAFFQADATVSFGGTAVAHVSVISTTQISIITPPHAPGTVDVTVTNLNGRSGTGMGLFTYEAGPTIASVSPANGGTGGGTAITISGANFQTGATVTIGGTAATGVVVSPTVITCVTPAYTLPVGKLAADADVTVTNPDGSFGTLAGGFSYQLRPSPIIPGAQPQPAPAPRA